jgi:hypothetical protein
VKWSIRTDSAPRSVGVLARSSDDRGGVPEVADVFAQLWLLRTGTSALPSAGFGPLQLCSGEVGNESKK